MATPESHTIDLTIAGMSCDHCVRAVKTALNSIAGIADSQVEIGSARITTEPGINPNTVREAAIHAIGAAGYQPSDYESPDQ